MGEGSPADGEAAGPSGGADAAGGADPAGDGEARFDVDLRSDTVTRPTRAMRRAMAEAPVGDDVLDGDPTTRRLEERTAELLGKEAALFFPSGTQANQTALRVHASPGREVVCEADAHVFHYELAAAAELSGVQLRPVPSERGLPGPGAWEGAIRGGDRYHPHTALLWTENTHNLHGGTVLPLEGLREVRELAGERGLPVHLDGARLWNACRAAGVEPAAYASTADTVMVSFSKGLGAPVGAALAGPAELVERAWVVRKRLGGGMRQSGVLAAAALVALEEGREALAADHRRARRLAELCRGIPGLDAPEPDTNIVMIEVVGDQGVDAPALSRALEERGVGILATGSRTLRAVTHRDVDDAGVERAAGELAAALGA